MINIEVYNLVLEKIKESNNIYDVVSLYVNLNYKGRNFIGICPFHSEKTASFFVYPESSSFYCFGCNTGGDVITFIRLIEKLDYTDALSFLAKRVGIDITDNKKYEELNFKKKIIYEINRESAKFFHKNLFKDLNENKNAFNYLLKRGIDKKIFKHFGLGFSSYSRFDLINFLNMKKYKEEEILSSGIAIKSKSGKLIDRFFGRIMFPIIDLKGNVIAFGARSMLGEMPKYLNTSDTLVFKKSENLFSLNFAKKSKNKIILTEGYLDAISLYQIGFKGATASLGTALTQAQARLLMNISEEIYLSYDSDEAGIRASQKAISIFRNLGISAKIISIPNFKDPNEYIKENKENSAIMFKKLLENAKSDIWYIISCLKEKFNLKNHEEKIIFLNESSKILSKIENPINREVYVSKICEEMNINKDAFKEQIKKLIKKKVKKNNSIEFNKAKKNLSVENIENKDIRTKYIEKIIISYIIKNGACTEKIDIVLNERIDMCFRDKLYKKIFEKILSLKKAEQKIDISSIINDFDFKEISEFMKIVSQYQEVDFTQDEILNYIKMLKKEYRYNHLSKGDSDINDILGYIDLLKHDKK